MPGEDIVGLLVGRVSPWVIIVFILWYGFRLISNAISSGQWIPKTTFDLVVAQYDKVVGSKDQTIASQERQIANLMETAETTQYTMKALREAGAVSDVPSEESADKR